MTKIVQIFKVLFRPALSNDYRWILKEYAVVDKTTNETQVVMSKVLTAKQSKEQRTNVVKRMRKVRTTGYLATGRDKAVMRKIRENKANQTGGKHA